MYLITLLVITLIFKLIFIEMIIYGTKSIGFIPIIFPSSLSKSLPLRIPSFAWTTAFRRNKSVSKKTPKIAMSSTQNSTPGLIFFRRETRRCGKTRASKSFSIFFYNASEILLFWCVQFRKIYIFEELVKYSLQKKLSDYKKGSFNLDKNNWNG